MKQFLTSVFCLFIISISAQEKTFKEFYKSHKQEADLSFNVPGFIANFFIDNQDDDELEALLEKSSNYKVLIYDDNSDNVLEDFKSYVKHNKLKTIVRIKDGNDRVNIHFREVKNTIREIIVNIHSNKKETVLIGLKTNLTRDELAELISSSDVRISSK